MNITVVKGVVALVVVGFSRGNSGDSSNSISTTKRETNGLLSVFAITTRAAIRTAVITLQILQDNTHGRISNVEQDHSGVGIIVEVETKSGTGRFGMCTKLSKKEGRRRLISGFDLSTNNLMLSLLTLIATFIILRNSDGISAEIVNKTKPSRIMI